MGLRFQKFDVDVEFLFESMAAASSDYLYLWDADQGIAVVSPNMAADLGIDDRALGDFPKDCLDRIHPRDRERTVSQINEFDESGESNFATEFQMRIAEGESYCWMRDSRRVRRNPETGKPRLVFGILHNMERDESVDHVTGLLKFARHKDGFEEALASREGFSGRILLLGIDDFAVINTLNSHNFGDEVLRATARDIRDILPEEARLYRFEGDQLLAVIEDSPSDVVNDLYARIKEYGAAPHRIGGKPYRFNVSAATIAYPEQGATWPDLEKGLSVALEKAKENGKGQCVEFTRELLDERLHEQMLASRLSEGARDGFKGFRAVFQPICLTKSLKIKGAEALMRFRDADGVDVSPNEFIPLLESTQLISPVGMWMIEQAIVACKEWSAFIPDFTMNVNVSFVQLRDSDFCDKVERLLEKHELDARNIVFELTESQFVSGDAAVSATLARLENLHVPIAMDDFGTGYSSLGRLAQFNVDVVKIDRVFVQALNRSRYNHDFVESVIRLCHNVGMGVCVEGVETRDELESVYLLNSDFVQGYYVSKPIEKDDFYRTFVQAPYDSAALAVDMDKEKLQKQLAGDRELLHAMTNATPLCLVLWDRDYQMLACNDEAVQLFEASSQQDLIDHFYDFSPERQPAGEPSIVAVRERLQPAFATGRSAFTWMHCLRSGTEVPTEVTAVRLPYQDDYIVASFTRDLRKQVAAQHENERFRLRLKALLDATPLCLNLWTPDLQNVMCNHEAAKLFGVENGQDYLDRFDELSPERQPDGQLSSEAAPARIREALERGRVQFPWMHQKLDGEPIPAEITLVRIEGLGSDGSSLVAGYTRDLREQVAAEKQGKKFRERLEALLNATPLCLNLWTPDLQNVMCNHEAMKLFDLENEQEYLDRFDELSPEYQPDGRLSSAAAAENIKKALKTGRVQFSWMHQKPGGEPVPAEITLVRIEGLDDDGGDMVAGYTRDLRELHKTMEMNERLAQLANFDALTGCLSRSYITESARTLFESSGEDDLLSLTYLDFDAFKEVNDTYGHEAGDIALKSVVSVVADRLPENALIGRLGGDEFLIVLQGMTREEVQLLMDDITRTVSNLTLYCGDTAFSTSVSMGSAFRDSLDRRAKDLLRRADAALYKAKRQGRNRGCMAS